MKYSYSLVVSGPELWQPWLWLPQLFSPGTTGLIYVTSSHMCGTIYVLYFQTDRTTGPIYVHICLELYKVLTFLWIEQQLLDLYSVYVTRSHMFGTQYVPYFPTNRTTGFIYCICDLFSYAPPSFPTYRIEMFFKNNNPGRLLHLYCLVFPYNTIHSEFVALVHL